MESTICGICGKSAFEDVAAPVIRERQKSWTTLVEQGDPKKVSIVFGLLLPVAVAAVFVLTRPDATVTTTELPPPDPDAVPVREHVEPQDSAPPSVDSANREGDIITPRAPREVTDTLRAWRRSIVDQGGR
ncbi:MAG: hypothetical protein P8J50_00295 [Acidimicrobiales bacterium]|nr:hypothetical protein [Acidimicrobiales bacterium]